MFLEPLYYFQLQIITYEDEKSLVFNDEKNVYDFGFDDQKVLDRITFHINEHDIE